MKHIYSSASAPVPRTLVFAAITLISTLIATSDHLDQSRWIKVVKGDQAKKFFSLNQGDFSR
jgi:hypothetical protein